MRTELTCYMPRFPQNLCFRLVFQPKRLISHANARDHYRSRRCALNLVENMANHLNRSRSLLLKDWKIPERRKPGRKPAVDSGDDKRKEQNRTAQRNFRERRRQREQEAEERLSEQAKKHEDEMKRMQQHMEALDRQRAQEIHALRAKLELREEVAVSLPAERNTGTGFQGKTLLPALAPTGQLYKPTPPTPLRSLLPPVGEIYNTSSASQPRYGVIFLFSKLSCRIGLSMSIL